MDFSLNKSQLLIKNTVRNFVQKECPEELVNRWDNEDFFPYKLFDQMAELNLFGLPFSEEYGGEGLGMLELVLVAEELSRYSFEIGAGYGIPIFNAMTLIKFGSEKQIKSHIEDIITHRRRFSISITEPDAGSDAGSLKSTAHKNGNSYLINGQKTFTTGADIPGSTICMYLRTGDADSRHRGLSLFLVPNDLKGLTIRRIPTLGRRILPACEIFMDNVILPEDSLVGSLNDGWNILMAGLNYERIFSTACYIGNTQEVLNQCIKYAKDRKQFGRPIGTFQAIGHMIADMQSELEACRLLAYRGAWLLDQGKNPTREISIAKLMGSELYVKTTNQAMQIMGGYGYSLESSMQRYFRDARICTVTAGSSQIQRNIICRELRLKTR